MFAGNARALCSSVIGIIRARNKYNSIYDTNGSIGAYFNFNNGIRVIITKNKIGLKTV